MKLNVNGVLCYKRENYYSLDLWWFDALLSMVRSMAGSHVLLLKSDGYRTSIRYFFRQIDLHVFSCIANSSIVSLKRVSRYARLILVTSNVLRLNACNIANGMKHVSRMMGHCYCCCC